MKNGNEGRDVPAVHESVTVPVGRDGKIRTALRTDQIVEFVTVTSGKKMMFMALSTRV